MENLKNQSKEVEVMGLMKVTYAKDTNGKIHIVLKSLCDGMGIDYNAQNQRIKRDKDLLNPSTCKMHVVQNEGNREISREVICLQLEALPFFLTGISSSQVKESIRENLKDFKFKAKDILAKAFLGEQGEKTEEFFNNMGWESKIIELTNVTDHLKEEIADLKSRTMVLPHKRKIDITKNYIYPQLENFNVAPVYKKKITQMIKDTIIPEGKYENIRLDTSFAIAEFRNSVIDTLKIIKENNPQYFMNQANGQSSFID